MRTLRTIVNHLPRPIALLAVVAALSAALLASLNPSPVAAADFGVDQRVVVATDALNVRAGPGLDEQVFHVATNGMLGTVNDGPEAADGYTWYQVSFDAGGNGWVVGEYLAPASGGGGGYPGGTRVEVTAEVVNVRAAPELDAAIVNTLPAGYQAFIAEGPVSAGGYDWYRLDAMDQSLGWVAGEFLAPADDSGGGFPDGARVAVNTDLLNVRSAPGLGGAVVNTLPEGYQAFISDGPVAADGYTWYQVDAMGQTLGWVAGEFLVLV